MFKLGINVILLLLYRMLASYFLKVKKCTKLSLSTCIWYILRAALLWWTFKQNIPSKCSLLTFKSEKRCPHHLPQLHRSCIGFFPYLQNLKEISAHVQHLISKLLLLLWVSDGRDHRGDCKAEADCSCGKLHHLYLSV